MTGGREDWFLTPVWFFDYPTPDALNASLLSEIHAERASDPVGMSGKSTNLGWHSRDDLHLRAHFITFLGFVQDAVAVVARQNLWDISRFQPVVMNCWAIINGLHGSNVVHTHPMSLLSGVYYLQADEGAGHLFFLDPRPAANVIVPPVTGYQPSTFQKVRYAPKPGRLILFPAWLPHGVEPNGSSSERIAVSFNVGMKPN